MVVTGLGHPHSTKPINPLDVAQKQTLMVRFNCLGQTGTHMHSRPKAPKTTPHHINNYQLCGGIYHFLNKYIKQLCIVSHLKPNQES